VRYREAIRYLVGLEPRGISLGLARVRKALAQRGDPQRGLQFVVVAGTNGKGSVASMMASVLKHSGLRVGLYTSPHLHRLVERFRVNGRTMPTAELARRVAALRGWLERPGTPQLTFFEVCTLLALEYFRDAGCQWVVLEVGLGGRLDATNVVEPQLAVITRIALDHQDRLGPTIRHIAREKAGIIKPGVPVVTGERVPEALRVLEARARRLGAPLSAIDTDFAGEQRARGHSVRIAKWHIDGLRLPLHGDYQADNLACAVTGLKLLEAQGVPIDERALRKGIASVRWPGRLELLPGAPDVLFDAAHNPDACRALASHVQQLTYPRKVLLFGVLKDKDHARMLQLLLPCFDEVVFGTPDSPRGLSSADLRARFGGTAFDCPGEALPHARKRSGKRGLIVAAGSILWMSAVRALVLDVREDPKIAL